MSLITYKLTILLNKYFNMHHCITVKKTFNVTYKLNLLISLSFYVPSTNKKLLPILYNYEVTVIKINNLIIYKKYKKFILTVYFVCLNKCISADITTKLSTIIFIIDEF